MIPIKDIEGMAENCSGEIKHENGNNYDILGFTKVKLGGKWIDVITYHDSEGELYSRIPSDFGRFDKI